MRLDETARSHLSREIATPAYDRKQSRGVVHFGVGAFHKAHQAAYFDRLMDLGETGWMITGISLRSKNISQQLNPQDGLYCLKENSATAKRVRLVGSIAEVLFGLEEPQCVIERLANPETKLVTLTVTEKGYCLDPSTGEFQFDHPDVIWDVKNPDRPRSAVGFLVTGLELRRQAGLPPFTTLSCDNIPDNGERLKKAVIALAARRNDALASWVLENAAFPNSMVDRIVPATTDAAVTAFEADYGVSDLGLVETEDFSQWVIEDDFCNQRPPLEKVGVQVTDNVKPWEDVKLRLLNAAHSAMAYLGYLSGRKYIHETITSEGFEAYINALWDEAETTLPTIEGFDVAAYRNSLIARFKNPNLAHKTFQIAMDGSQKIPQRLLSSIRERLDKGLASPALTLAVAGWMRWQNGVDESGETFEVQDPMAETLRLLAKKEYESHEDFLQALVSLTQIFDNSLAGNSVFLNALKEEYALLIRNGVAVSIQLGRR